MTAPDITARIAEGRRLEKAATPGSWTTKMARFASDGEYDCAIYSGEMLLAESFGRCSACRVMPAEPNAALIARMRNEYAALLDVVEAAQNLASAAVPQWAPKLRAALAAYARAGGAQ